jgi:hypothetical protein
LLSSAFSIVETFSCPAFGSGLTSVLTTIGHTDRHLPGIFKGPRKAMFRVGAGLPANNDVGWETVRGQGRSYNTPAVSHGLGRRCFARRVMAYPWGSGRWNSSAAGERATEYTVFEVTQGGDLASTRVAKPEVHAEVR